MESATQAAEAEKQSTVLPSWDDSGTYILVVTNSYLIALMDHLMGGNSYLIV